MTTQDNKFTMKKRLFFPLFFILIFLAASTVVMILWNAVLVQVTNVSSINYLQAMGILALSRILFGGFKFSPWHHRRYDFPSQVKEKFMNMTEEEKEKFKEEMKRRCGRWR